ncbi:MIT domain-containing protein 1 [Eupeodes corollae]|uniref:MIT domain-containing protein 1 n=1 Tax=Eupeodes corollae TaxID=290404 RepID=UPI00248FB864|nr:MIT domain-containing protein 1 [Eupeodes corollae]
MSLKEILIEACECDRAGRILQAQHLYQDGILVLLATAEAEKLPEKRKYYIGKIDEYKTRLDVIRKKIDAHTTKGDVVDNIPIMEGSTGHSYRQLFGKYLDNEVKEVELDEAYLMENHQMQNLVMFLELVVKSCHSLRYIRIVTKKDERTGSIQKESFDSIKTDLARRNIQLAVEYQSNLHDRKIVLSNGYIIKIGRGLDIYKPKTSRFCLGMTDYDFRECRKTEVDIWKCKKYD